MFRGFIIATMFIFVTPFTYAQTAPQSGETPAQRQARLQAELVQVEREQAETQKVLQTAQQQSASLGRDVLILDTKIKVATLNIKAKNLLIETLGKDITKKERTITDLLGRIENGRQSLAQIMRKTNEVDSITIPEIVLSQRNLTEVFSDLDTFQSVQESLKTTFEEIRATKSQTENEKNSLDKRKNSEVDAKQVILKEQNNIKIDQAEKQRLLAVSKGNEKAYSNIIAKKQQQAAQIRAALFELAGGSKAIPFGEAYKYALTASQKTGVRPAFLLAILTQESSLGANVGSCYVTDLATGDGVGKNTGIYFERVMYAKLPGNTTSRPSDTVPFKEITESLGMDWKTTPVSCPIGDKTRSGKTYYVGRGFGGAMGPAQFIPSTWMPFKNRLASALSVAVPSPWSPPDAFMASAMYLSDLGARGGSYSGEVRAACKYYGTGGNSCSYGTSVMKHANSIQTNMIDPLQGI
jgi:membrane-bound lytic murein transglycosylase B